MQDTEMAKNQNQNGQTLFTEEVENKNLHFSTLDFFLLLYFCISVQLFELEILS